MTGVGAAERAILRRKLMAGADAANFHRYHRCTEMAVELPSVEIGDHEQTQDSRSPHLSGEIAAPGRPRWQVRGEVGG